jgi:hypothetical protein
VQKTQVKVYPEVLRDKLWGDLSIGFIGHSVYLGQTGVDIVLFSISKRINVNEEIPIYSQYK